MRWQIVDASFEPDETAFALLERDVFEPWLATRRATIRTDVCGTRAFTMQIRRVKGKGAFTLTISRP